MRYLLGIDLGGSSVKAAAVTAEGSPLGQSTRPFDPEAPGQFITAVCLAGDELAARLGAPPDRIGLSAPGLAGRNGRHIAFLPGRLAGLEGLDWTDCLRAPRPVPVLNDAHAALLGEVWLGAARGAENAILLTLGTGVGGAALVDGRLLRGALGRAGHLGHLSLDPAGAPDICGTPGSLELAIGNATIGERSRGRFTTTHELIRAYEAGDAPARAIWLDSIRALAAAVASLINILDPEVVILGGGIARAGPALFDPLTAHLDRMEWRPGGHRVRIAAATMGEFAGAFGAAWHALRTP
jgi:glucokinase